MLPTRKFPKKLCPISQNFPKSVSQFVVRGWCDVGRCLHHPSRNLHSQYHKYTHLGRSSSGVTRYPRRLNRTRRWVCSVPSSWFLKLLRVVLFKLVNTRYASSTKICVSLVILSLKAVVIYCIYWWEAR